MLGGRMDLLELGLFALGLCVMLYASLALIAAFVRAGWLGRPIFGSQLFLGKVEATPRIRVFMASWLLALGLHISLASAAVSPWQYVALAAALVLFVPVALIHAKGRR